MAVDTQPFRQRDYPHSLVLATAAQWAATGSFHLEAWQTGRETDTGLQKTGPGVWRSLAYDNSTPPAPAEVGQITPGATLPLLTAPVSRVETWTASGAGTEDKLLAVPMTDLTYSISGAVTAATTSSSAIAKGTTAATFMGHIMTWLNTGSNAEDTGILSADDNGDGTGTVTYVAGALANSQTPTTNDPALSFAEVTAGADSMAVSATLSDIVNGRQREIGTEVDVIFEPEDNAGVIVMGSDNPHTIAIPDPYGELPSGFTCTVIQKGAGTVTFIDGNGLVFQRQDKFAIAGQKGVATIIRQGSTNRFYLAGDLA